MKSKKFQLNLVEAWQPEFWVDQAIEEIRAWATYNEVPLQQEIEALLELQELTLKALSLGLYVHELL